jgi:endonuclease/exonuclease/phosphatase family metal-dependent hydrolase
MTADGYRPQYPKPEAEKAALRAVIRELNADVLVLQEIGPAPYFTELRRDLKAEGSDYPYYFLLEAADPDRHLALLSRRPFRTLAPHPDLKFSYLGKVERVKRGLVEATLSTEIGELTLFGLHLKSRFSDRDDDRDSAERRLGEATAIRDAILQRFPEPGSPRFLILGDCNDGRTSKPVQRLQQRGGTFIAKLLPAADAHGESWTHFYRKEEVYSRFDHVFVSRALLPQVRDGAARILDRGPLMIASDHRPVVVVLDLKPAEATRRLPLTSP